MKRINRIAFATLFLVAAALPAWGQTNAVRLTDLQATSEGLHLSWSPGAAGSAYTVQFQDTLQDGIWRIPDSSTPFPISSNAWLAPSTTNATRFFRVLPVPAAQRGKLISASLSNTLSNGDARVSFQRRRSTDYAAVLCAHL
jgi:hypothetical protein